MSSHEIDSIARDGANHNRIFDREVSRLLAAGVLLVLFLALLSGAAQPVQAQTYSVLYTFCSQANCTDGAVPNANLVLDGDGNLFGTTLAGGVAGDCGNDTGCGTVFEVAPGGTESVLYAFDAFANGLNPEGGVIQDETGKLYGTTVGGGNHQSASLCHGGGCGVIYELPRRPAR